MLCIARLVRSARDRVCPVVPSDVILRHESTGTVLSDGSLEPVRFPNRELAIAFAVRFLDEAPCWRPVPAAGPARAAGVSGQVAAGVAA